MRELLARLNIAGFDTNAYIDNNRDNASALPNIAIAVSGGSYRATLNGAGAIAAFDSRTPNSTSAGHIGGLLQASTYVSALSGGGWLVGSLYMNNFTTVQEIISTTPKDESALWEFENSILEGPDVVNTFEYWSELIDSVKDKAAAGFDTSITDLWGRALSFQLIDAPLGGPGRRQYCFAVNAINPTDVQQPIPFHQSQMTPSLGTVKHPCLSWWLLGGHQEKRPFP